MRNIATIKGFNKENIMKSSELLLGSKEQAEAMIEQALKAGIFNLLHVPDNTAVQLPCLPGTQFTAKNQY